MSNGYHAADDGSLARSTGGAAARGAMLIALAIIIGLLLLTFALNDSSTEVAVDETETSEEEATDDGTDTEENGDDSSDAAVDAVDPSTDETDTTVEEDPESIPEETIDATDGGRSPSEVNVLVANGIGTSGIAGSTADALNADGYIGVAADAPDTTTSVIYYREGYDAEARNVATSLGAPPDVIQPVPADGSVPINQNAIDDGRAAAANVIVILGSDGVVPPA